ncbi:MAG: chemotaxis protein CheW [Acidimicrobiales bacterium]
MKTVAAATSTLTQHRVCTFYVGEQIYGLDVHAVREILKTQATTPVPNATAALSGLINLRGEIVTSIDLRKRLELPPKEVDEATMSVVVSLADEVISLIVDRVGEVVELANVRLEPVPATVPAVIRDMALGVCRTPAGLVQLLDASKLVMSETDF